MEKMTSLDFIEKIKGQQISFHYHKEFPIFDELDFSLPSGEVIGIVGENGIGKSTLARLCVGLEQPQRGDILFNLNLNVMLLN